MAIEEITTHTNVLKSIWERAPTQYGIELQYNMGANSPYTHKSIKGSMGASYHTIWERTHQTTLEDELTKLMMTRLPFCLFVLFACLFVEFFIATTLKPCLTI